MRDCWYLFATKHSTDWVFNRYTGTSVKVALERTTVDCTAVLLASELNDIPIGTTYTVKKKTTTTVTEVN